MLNARNVENGLVYWAISRFKSILLLIMDNSDFINKAFI